MRSKSAWLREAESASARATKATHSLSAVCPTVSLVRDLSEFSENRADIRGYDESQGGTNERRERALTCTDANYRARASTGSSGVLLVSTAHHDERAS